MYGRQIGTLLLALNDQVVWSLSSSQEDEWLLAQVYIPKGSYEVKYNYYFKYFKLKSHHQDIKIVSLIILRAVR